MPRKRGQGSKWIRPLKRQAVYDRDGRACVCCGKTEEQGAFLTLDHVVACELLEKPDNRPENLVTMCRSCNSSKQDKTMRTWLKVLREQGVDSAAVSRRIRNAVRRDWRKHLARRKAERKAQAH